MNKKKAAKEISKLLYVLVVTGMIGEWGIQTAYMERGYKAFGGEYILLLVTCWAAWKAISYLFKTLEELEDEQKCKKRRSGRTSWMCDNR